MKILLINQFPYYATGTEGTIYPPLGLAYIASVLEKSGYKNVRVLDANVLRLRNEEVIKKIAAYTPDIIGVSSNIVTQRAAIELCKIVKERFPEKLLVVGGPLPILQPEKFLKVSDVIVNGEGEIPFLEIVRAWESESELKDIPGTVSLHNEEIKVNIRPELIGDMDSIPFPAYHLMEPELKEYSRKARIKKQYMAPILTSRGCPYQCTYCNKSVFGSTFRMRSAENVMSEIDWLLKNFEVRQIDILDDNFNLNPERTNSILDGIIAGRYDLAINCHNGLRVDRLTRELAGKLKRAGVFKVGVGVESGDERVLESVKKKLKLHMVRDVIKWFREENVVVHGYFIFGLPGDNRESMQNTINFAKEANPHFANFAICIPFPGTAVYDYVKKNGKFLKDVDNGVEAGFFDGTAFFEDDITRGDEVVAFNKKAFKSFYFRPLKVADILFSIHSFSELKWIISQVMSVLYNLFGKKLLRAQG